MVFRSLLGVLTLSLFATTAVAQEARGTIQGRVSDPTGSAVPGALVEVLNVETGVVTPTTSNAEGSYRVPFLNPGTYRVTVTLDGFSKFVSEDLRLHVAAVLNVDAPLKVGSRTEEVTVTASTTTVDNATAELGQVIDARRIAELPIREGSAVELVVLAPGVQNTTDLRSRKAAFNNGLSQFSSDGAGDKRNDFTIDGVANVAMDRVAYSPPSASVEEFKIHTSSYDAAVGNAMGASVNLVTKSGTNTIRGQAYEWFRGSALDSRQFFDKLNNRPKRDYEDNRFGGAVGGPIRTNKTFYFGNFEANIWQGPQPQILTVPTAKMRSGDFSELLALGPQYQIYNPFTTRPAAGGRFVRDPFVGNIIPPHLIDPIAKKILDYYPLPNIQGTADHRNNFQNPTAVAFEEYWTATGRIDHNFSAKHRLYGRLSWDFWEEEKDDRFDNVATGIFLNRKNRILAVDDAYTLRNNLLINVRGGFTRQLFPERRRSQGVDLAGLGFSQTLLSLIPDRSRATLPFVDFDNFQDLSPWESGDGYFTTDVYSAIGNVLWLIGRHSTKFGTEYRRYVEDASRFPRAVSPQINFGTTWTRGPLDNSTAAPMGQDLASFLLGLPTGGSMQRAAAYRETSSVLSLYAHDDWRVRNNLTLNLGVRWEIEGPLTEAGNQFISGFDFTGAPQIAPAAEANYARNPIADVPVSQFKVRGGLLYPDTGGPKTPFDRRWGNIMPRAGFAWLATPKTSVRGGYGMYYDMLGANRLTVNQVGYSRDTSLTASLDNGQTFVATLANPFPNGLLEPVGSSLGLMTSVGQGITFPYVGEVKTPRTHRTSIGIQRELPLRLLVEATYVGSWGEDLPVTRQLNAVPRQYFSTSPTRDNTTNNVLTQQVPNPFAGLLPGTGLNGANVARSQLLRPYPQFTSVQASENIGSSSYNALQLRIERRMAKGVTVQAGYSWSKSIMQAGTASNPGTSGFLNEFDETPERVISPWDRAHTFSSSGLVELPVGRGRRWGRSWRGVTNIVLGGWQVSYIYKAQSGAPLGFGNFLFAAGKTIDDVAIDNPTYQRWFNVDAFNRATAEQLVSNVRTQPSRFEEVRGPGYSLLDLGLLKNIGLGGSRQLQVRFELYNALDTVNLAGPNTAPTNSAFGTITAQNGLSRQLQIAARLSF
ncbi:MAG TPA: carboxypeptidase regulatory-like domain-containing protein [Vicinamibacterales bacterium]|nr:carboxypeptidase regulatory-like domain-containing protein [Vicinamibacterales bacterium]